MRLFNYSFFSAFIKLLKSTLLGLTVCFSAFIYADLTGDSLEEIVRFNSVQSIQVAIETGQLDVQRKDEKGKTFLHHAVGVAKKKLAKIFLENGVDKDAQDEYGFTALRGAVLLSDLGMIDLFIEHKVDLDKQDEYGQTALYDAIRAASFHKAKVLKKLLKAGAKVGIQDKEKRTPIEYAYEQRSSLEIIELLEKAESESQQCKENFNKTS